MAEARSQYGRWPLRKITPALIDEFEALFAEGKTQKGVARATMIPAGIVRRWLDAGAEAAVAYYDSGGKGPMPLEAKLHLRCEKARGQFVSMLQEQLIEAGAGKESSPGSAGWQLERLENDEWGMAQKVEFTGRDGGPLEVEGRVVVGLADVISLYRELGKGHLLGLGDGAAAPALPGAREILPATPVEAAGGPPAVPGS